MLTKEAFNALLKTLEEPPPHVVFVLATTEVHKIPATILSRCQRFDFRRPRVHDIALVLGQIAASEQIEIDEPAILEIARHAEGGFRDAIGTLEKLSTFFGAAAISSREVLDVLGVIASELLFEIIDIVIERDPASALLFVQRLAERGTSYPQFIHDLLRHLRQIFLVQYLDDVSDDPATLLALAQNLEIDEQLLDRLSAPGPPALGPRAAAPDRAAGPRPDRDPRRSRPSPAARDGAGQGGSPRSRPLARRTRGTPAPAGVGQRTGRRRAAGVGGDAPLRPAPAVAAAAARVAPIPPPRRPALAAATAARPWPCVPPGDGRRAAPSPRATASRPSEAPRRRRRHRRAHGRRRPRQTRLAARAAAGRNAERRPVRRHQGRPRARRRRAPRPRPALEPYARQGLEPRQPRAAHSDHRAHYGRRPRPAVRARTGPGRTGRAQGGRPMPASPSLSASPSPSASSTPASYPTTTELPEGDAGP